MSYDISLFKPNEGESVDDALDRLFDSDGSDQKAPSPEEEAIKERLAHALLAENPRLELTQFDYPAVANSSNTTKDDTRRKPRYFELNGADGNGIQIEIADSKASISLPYWHKGRQARSVFEEVWKYLKVFETEAGYLAYDPQLGRPLDLNSDFAEVIEIYTGTIEAVESAIAASGEKTVARQPKPWWKFW